MLLLLASARAATLVVDPADGSAYGSIQAAIDAAADGDTVFIAAGTYAECLDLSGRSLTLEGSATVANAPGCAQDSSVLATLGEALTVRGLSFTNPTGRVFESIGGSLTLDEVVVEDVDNTATYLPGAAVSLTNGTLVVTGSSFRNLRSIEGGALFIEDSDATIESSTFSDAYASFYGGAIEFYSHGDDTLVVSDTSFTDCSVDSYLGSAIYAWTSDASDVHTSMLTITASSFDGNSSAADAGAVALSELDEATIESCTFEANDAVIGAAIQSEGSETLVLTGNLFIANAASTSVAGAVYLSDGTASLTRNVFMGNTASTVGAVELYDTSATVLNNTFVGNAGSLSSAAGAIFVRNSTVDFRNNLVAYTSVGPAVWVYDGTSAVTWAYNAVWENADGDAGAYASLSTGVDGNLAVDPSLVAWSDDDDYANDDLRLAVGSPLIDAGDPSVLDDDGTVSDIGAYAGSVATDSDGDGFQRDVDCDDHDPDTFPGADERCDSADDDCDGEVDEDAVDALEWYPDVDGDGTGDSADVVSACETPEGYVGTGGDCDDADPAIAPGMDESCNSVDDDCDGGVDEDAVDATTWYADADGDAYGDLLTTIAACSKPDGFTVDLSDCDDTVAEIHPGAAEVCNEADDNCDGSIDEAGATGGTVFHPDEDADGFGDSAEGGELCTAPEGWLEDATDCDDTESTTFPGAEDTWYDGVDSDCAEDDDYDQDLDGYDLEEDCEDTDPSIHPDAADEWYDGVDTDCAGNDDFDQDLDGIVLDEDCDDTSASVYPGAPDTWYDGVDSDCQGDDDNDQDRDGYALDVDCDDTNAALHPEATDIAGDDIDQDCDGEDRAVDKTEDEGGCGCASTTPAVQVLVFLPALLVLARRRRGGGRP